MTDQDIVELRRLAESARDADAKRIGEMTDENFLEHVAAHAADTRLENACKPATILALLDRLETAEADAARYRWLMRACPEMLPELPDIDAHIDRERAATKENNDGP